MAVFLSELFGLTLVSRFNETPTSEDFRRWVGEIRAGSVKCGRPVWLVTAISEDHTPPSPAIAKGVSEHLATFRDQVAGMSFVIEGEGFSHSLRRSVLTGILVAMRTERGRATIYSTIDDAIAALGAPYARLDLRGEITRAGLDRPRRAR
jgi:hypothetical protein